MLCSMLVPLVLWSDEMAASSAMIPSSMLPLLAPATLSSAV